jgi:hypothetical protein
MLYDDIFAAVVVWTNKPGLVSETQLAIKQAVTAAHRSARFPRDLIRGPQFVAPVPAADGTQKFDYTAAFTYVARPRQLAGLIDVDRDIRFTQIDVTDQRDQDGFYKLDVVYLMGVDLIIRPAVAANLLKIEYYFLPDPLQFATGQTIDDWLCISHFELIVLMAAASVLALIGEQEIKQRVEMLAASALADLKHDELELFGR